MKITVMVPKNEEGNPNKGEWVRELDRWVYVSQPSCWTSHNYAIGKAYEIDVPDSTREAIISFYGESGNRTHGDYYIGFPRPKKKVKKWNWVLPCISSPEAFVPAGYYTEEGIKQTYPNRGYYHKVIETEIETDE